MTRHGDTAWRSLHPPNTFLFCIQVHMYLFVRVHVHLSIAYFRETDKQRICVNTQLKNPIYPIKIERLDTHTQTKKPVSKQIFM